MNKRHFFSVNIIFLILLTIILMPLKEKSLGHLIKLVMVHASLIQISLAILLINAIIAIVAFFYKTDILTRVVKIMMTYSVATWLLGFLGSVWVTKAAWGGIDWQEPRFMVSTQLLFILLPFWGLNLLINYDWLTRFTTAGIGIFAQFLIRLAPIKIHPENPIGMSDGYLFKFGFSAVLLVLTLWTSWLIYTSIKFKRMHEPEKP